MNQWGFTQRLVRRPGSFTRVEALPLGQRQ
jgi:hypothetical protein